MTNLSELSDLEVGLFSELGQVSPPKNSGRRRRREQELRVLRPCRTDTCVRTFSLLQPPCPRYSTRIA